ncbi:hypothetical protein ACFVP0_18605 [Streptomyces cinereoruber]|uniref:hypothetical protein n=1 Tax=Streptomyces cinereoruber TaxID=67260 RepID=UPI003685CE03
MVEQRRAAVVGARGAAGLFASRAALRTRYLRLLTEVPVFQGGSTAYVDAATTHPVQALRLLADPTTDETRLLGAFTYARNPTVPHTDTSLLPGSPRARAGWNYRMAACEPSTAPVHVGYDMERLQRPPAGAGYVVTLGGDDGIAPDRVVERMVYEHPVYTPTSVAAQRELPPFDTGVTAYAGAWHGAGVSTTLHGPGGSRWATAFFPRWAGTSPCRPCGGSADPRQALIAGMMSVP